jgi:hypothetical protein
MIPPFSLPSNPDQKIYLREATVADAIDFAGVDEGHEEEVTTLFLNRLQLPEHYLDAGKWTADDRRLALFWYFLHTARDTVAPLPYDCRHCGQRHDWLLDLKALGENYKSIQGKAEREFDFEGEKIIVRPLTGADLEELEMLYLAVDEVGRKQGKTSGAYKKELARIKLQEELLVLNFPLDVVTDETERRQAKEKKVLALTSSQFAGLVEQVEAKLTEMEHGLESVYAEGRLYLLTPPHVCPNTKEREVTTRLRIPFRGIDYIPGI